MRWAPPIFGAISELLVDENRSVCLPASSVRLDRNVKGLPAPKTQVDLRACHALGLLREA